MLGTTFDEEAVPRRRLSVAVLAAALLLGCASDPIPAAAQTASGTGGGATGAGGAGGAGGAAPDPLVVVTDRGSVRGAVDGATIAFKGIPYVAISSVSGVISVIMPIDENWGLSRIDSRNRRGRRVV